MTVMVATIAAGSVSLASPGIASTGHTLQQCGTKPWPCHLPLSPSPPAPAQNIAALLHWVSSTQDRGCPSHALVRGWPSHVLDRGCHSHALLEQLQSTTEHDKNTPFTLSLTSGIHSVQPNYTLNSIKRNFF